MHDFEILDEKLKNIILYSQTDLQKSNQLTTKHQKVELGSQRGKTPLTAHNSPFRVVSKTNIKHIFKENKYTKLWETLFPIITYTLP